MATMRFQWRKGTAATAAANNGVLLEGEAGYETDTGQWKIGDGVTPWNDLPYQVAPADLADVLAGLDDKADIADVGAIAAADVGVTGTDLGDALADEFAGLAALAPRRRPKPPVITKMITAFQTGHGWFTGGADNALKNLDDPSDFVLGTQSALIVTQANTTTTATLSNYPIAAVDMTGKQFVVWVKAENMPRLGSLLLRAGSAADANSNYYVLRVSGGSVSNAILGNNEWVPIVFGWADATSTGTPNRAAITALQLRVAPNGANAEATRVRFNGIATTPEPTTLYPNGVVSVTFDDTLASQYTAARPRLDKYGFPATAYTIVENVDTAGHLTLAQLHALENQAGWEVAAHSWSIADHNLPNGFNDLTEADLEANFRRMKDWLLGNGFKGADHIAYPKGKFDNGTVETVTGRYFSTAVTTTHFVAQAIPTFRPLRIARYSVEPTDTPATLTAEIDKAYANRTWLILCFHDIVASGAVASTEYNQADYNTVIDYLATKGIPVRTVGQVAESLLA